MAALSAALMSAKGEVMPNYPGGERGKHPIIQQIMGREPLELKGLPNVAIPDPKTFRMMAVRPPRPRVTPDRGQEISREWLWQEFFSDPSKWWDNRFDKKNPRSPDFKHKCTNEALWIKGPSNPPWVKAELAIMIRGQMQAGTVRTLCKAGRLKEALHILNQGGVRADSNTYLCVLRECISKKSLAEGKQVHAHIIQTGFKPNIILLNNLVNMYARSQSLVEARQVFEKMAERNLVTWTIMIAGYTKHGCAREALEIYEKMQEEGVVPDKVMFICILNMCASLGALEKGKEVHADILKAGIGSFTNLENTIVDMYAKCGSVKDARQVFDNMERRDVVSWNAIIGGYAKHGYGREALELYEQMIREGMKPNKVTFCCVLNACASLAALVKGMEVHADIKRFGSLPNTILETALVDMYAKCGSMKDACQVFENMALQDVVSWSVMITGYAQQGCGREAFVMYEEMRREGVTPNEVTFIGVLNACASMGALDKGKDIHADIRTARITSYVNLDNSLLNMYAKCGSMKDAQQLFNDMTQRDVVSWNSIIAGYAQRECGQEALEIYEQMIQDGVTPDKVTFACVLNACASLTALEKGREVHTAISTAGFAPDVILETAVVNMYAKCGNVVKARSVFDNMVQWNVVSWNAMIAGYAQHGFGRRAFQLFEEMQQEGFRPDGITFICLLSGCSHLGLVDEGHHYFESMSQDHGLTPTVEHFGSMVDLLGRAGRLDEAEDFVNGMPIKPDAALWQALLGACRIHGNLELAERMAKCFLTLDPENAATYVLLSNSC